MAVAKANPRVFQVVQVGTGPFSVYMQFIAFHAHCIVLSHRLHALSLSPRIPAALQLLPCVQTWSNPQQGCRKH